MNSILNVIFAVLVLGVLGLLFGAALAFASKVFLIEKNPNLDKLIECLPGANCGACGYAGCSAYAEALCNENADVDLCPVGGESAMATIADILGVELKKNTRLTSLVRCNGGDRCKRKFDYIGIKDCVAASKVSNGPLACQYGCFGYGSCLNACQFGAISIINGVAKVDHELCTGCLKCVEACPRNIIIPVPYTADVNVVCSSHERGVALRKTCEIGCIGCKICVKTCKYDAIHVEDNLAVIDYDKCTSCGECAVKCPRHLIVDSKLHEETAVSS